MDLALKIRNLFFKRIIYFYDISEITVAFTRIQMVFQRLKKNYEFNNMLKRLTTLAITFLALSAAIASPIDKPSALSNAKAFLSSRGLPLELSATDAVAYPRSGQSNQACFYVFNAVGNQGFVIASANDCANPILGYSDKGHVDLNNMPDGLRSLLGFYQEELDQLITQDENGEIVKSNGPRHSMSVARYPIKPLLTKFFGHPSPYKDKNPQRNDSICASGCATIALSEILAYYSYPAVFPAQASYTTETQQIVVPELPDAAIDWSNIKSNYTIEAYNKVEKEAVATLVRYVGQGLKSDYMTTGGTSSRANMLVSLVKKLGYNCSSMTYATTKLVNEWEDIIYDDLSHGRPILVTGSNIAPRGSGHAFVIDGYDQDDYYHIDWGWTADAQGYFRLMGLSPYKDTNTYTYMRNVAFLYNVEPKTTYVKDNTIPPYSNLQLTKLVISNGFITTTSKNMLTANKEFIQGLGLVDASNQLVKVVETDTMTFKSGQSISKTWEFVDCSDVKDGNYRLYPVSKLSDGDGIWHFSQCNSVNAFAYAKVSKGKPTLSVGKAVVYNSFYCDSSLTFVQGAARNLYLNLTNNTMDQFNQRLYLFEDDFPIHYTIARVPTRSTNDLEFLYFPKTTGEHTLKLCTDTARKTVLFERKVDVKKSVSYKLSFTYEVDNYDADNGYLYGNKIRVRFKVTNTGTTNYDDFIRVLLRQYSWNDTRKFVAHIPAGETREYEYVSQDLIYGVSYPLSVYYKATSTADNTVATTRAFNINFKPRRGLCYWKADGKLYASAPQSGQYVVPEDAVAISLIGNTTVPSSIVPNSNPNTLYYVTKKYANLNNLNQIVEDKADHITLTDGYSCFVPLDFKATNINYTRTFEKGFMGRRNENNWSTIVLPFTVQEVYKMDDETRIDWFKPNDESGSKDFWVRQFYGEEGLSVYFNNAPEMAANVPYIITVPGDYKGEEYSLVGKPIVFSAYQADVISRKPIADARNFNFQGSYSETDTQGDYVYFLDEEDRGNHFVYSSGVNTTRPFRAYFASETEPTDAPVLHIASYIDIPTAIEEVDGRQATTQGVTRVYSISGTMVKQISNATPSEILRDLPSGLYIINGKKYLK